MEPVSPAFAGRFLTTQPLGKSMALLLNEAICSTGLLNTILQQKKSDQIVMRYLYFILLLVNLLHLSVFSLVGDITLTVIRTVSGSKGELSNRQQ